MDISNQFIDQLFSHTYFISSLESFCSSLKTKQQCNLHVSDVSQIQTVAEDISEMLTQNFKKIIQKQSVSLYQSNRQIMQQIQQLKFQIKTSYHLNTQSSTVDRDTKSKHQNSLFFDNDDQYDMKQYRKQFDQQIENKILVNSFQLDQQQKTYIDLEIQQKINASIQGNINRIQLSLEEKFDKYSAKIQQRIEQLRKTIASVVQAMNQKQFWNKNQQKSNLSDNLNKPAIMNAFSKKEVKNNQNSRENGNSKHIQSQQAKIQKTTQVKNPQKQKKQNNHNSNNNSNKAMQSLNKSINMGRSKIKSLFGFKSTTIKQRDIQIKQKTQT